MDLECVENGVGGAVEVAKDLVHVVRAVGGASDGVTGESRVG